MRRVFLCGGLGFIGSHLQDRLEDRGCEIIIYDLLNGYDARDLEILVQEMRGCDTVIHLASNADIAASAANPIIDFDFGTTITQMVVEACRLTGVETIIYASGSGVYGDTQGFLTDEEVPFEPNSPYGASKVAGEALVSAYCHMFGMRGLAFRFANVVGPGQTHGVGFDFIKKLKVNPRELEILGDGEQTKSYIAVSDIIDAVLLATEQQVATFLAYNVSTNDELTVREIADMACEILEVNPWYVYTGGRTGWPGDVPVIRLASSKIRALGWSNKMSSGEAMRWALESLANEKWAVFHESYGLGDDLA